MKPLHLIVTGIVAALAGNLAQAQSATLIRDADLKQEPFTDSATISTLPGKTALTIITSQGGWTQVKDASGLTGWVRLLNVRPDTAGGSASGFLSSLTTLGNVSRTGTTGVVATTGVKGISKELLDTAFPDASERKRLDQYRATTKNARAYAKSQKLQSRELAWLRPADAVPPPPVPQEINTSSITPGSTRSATVRARGN